MCAVAWEVVFTWQTRTKKTPKQIGAYLIYHHQKWVCVCIRFRTGGNVLQISQVVANLRYSGWNRLDTTTHPYGGRQRNRPWPHLWHHDHKIIKIDGYVIPLAKILISTTKILVPLVEGGQKLCRLIHEETPDHTSLRQTKIIPCL